MSQQTLEETLNRYLHYLDQDKNNISLLMSIGNCYRQLNDFVKAQQYIDEVKKLTGRPYWTEQGILYLDQQDFGQAKDAFTEALLEEDSSSTRNNLAFCLYLNREFEQALHILSPVKEEQFETQRIKARVLQQLGRADECISLLENSLSKSNEEDDLWSLLALLYFDQNEIEKATSASKKALQLAPDNREALLVECLINSLNHTATLQDIESMQRFFPEDCRLHFARGTVEIAQHHFQEAKASFLKAVQSWPEFIEAWHQLAWCNLLLNDLDETENACIQAIEIDDQDGDSWGGLALVQALRNNLDQAQELAEKARLLEADSFFVTLTELIITTQFNPDLAARQFDTVFPDIREKIAHIMTQQLLSMNEEERVIH